MAFLSSGYESPEYLTLIDDREKMKAAVTESLEEYLVKNRFGLFPDRINVFSPLSYSIKYGYKANVKRLDYNFNSPVKTSKVVTKEKLLTYDFLATAGLDIPVMKAPIIDIFKKHCADKIQIIDVIITLKNGEEIHDYKAVNVINRVEAFTWEGSVKGMYYDEYLLEFKEFLAKRFYWLPEETRVPFENKITARFQKYGNPSATTMEIIAYSREIINQAIICKDSVTAINRVLISDDFARELQKHKFKGLGVFIESYGNYKIV